MIIAGEASADAHGAGVVRALRRRQADLVCFGVGGPALRDAGVEILVDAASLAVVGITEVAVKARALIDALGRVRRALARRRPALLVLIDLGLASRADPQDRPPGGPHGGDPAV
jgi:lipid-A-disaccharide synthase